MVEENETIYEIHLNSNIDELFLWEIEEIYSRPLR
jgi:hypothetical protein